MRAGATTADGVFAALADPTRRSLVQRLSQAGAATATQLAGTVPVSRQAVSKHLATLEAAGLVTPSRCGREVRYVLSAGAMASAMSWMVEVGARWDERLSALQRHLGSAP